MNSSPNFLRASLLRLLHKDAEKPSASGNHVQRNGSLLVLHPIITTYDVPKLKDFTTSLIEILSSPENYSNRLDDGLSPLLRIQSSDLLHDYSSLVQKASNLLLRFPKIPARVVQTPYLGLHQYFTAAPAPHGSNDGGENRKHLLGDLSKEDYHYDYYAQKDQEHESLWSSLVKDWPFSSNTLRIALVVADTLASPDITVARTVQKYVSFTGDLARVVQSHVLHRAKDTKSVPKGVPPVPDPLKAEGLVIWEIYLSICWQHGRMLLFYYILGAILNHTWSKEWGELFAVHDVDDSSWSATINQPKYLCSQALALLHRSKGSARFDSRTLFSHFSAVFGDRPGRCDPNDPNYICDGMIPQSCARFFGQNTGDQSMHDITCDRNVCRLIVWDPVSYDMVDGGARAVDIQHMEAIGNDRTQLLYCRADDTTLAISHVWSHGQGGRPETGFNSCLHQRYTSIARQYHCLSYWIDTCCIPTDENRRMEAIKGINGVFERSRMTLVCDMDLMAVTPDSSEQLLAVLLVADWNVRAWTLLEGLRGRNNIYLLLAGNAVVSFPSLCRAVFETGAMDLGCLSSSDAASPAQRPAVV